VSDPNLVPNEAVRAQLNRMLLWQGFADSPQLSRFLRYLVEQTLGRNAGTVKEYSIGVEVFNRTSAFDPKSDSIVRSEARRLRSKLAEYYSGAGAEDSLRIDVPKGRYVAVFSVRNGTAPPVVPATEAAAPAHLPIPRWRLGAALAGLVLIALTLGYSPHMREPAPPAVPVRRSVAVLDFDNLSKRAGDAWLSGAISGMVGTELGADGKLRTIPGEDVAHMEKDLGLGGAQTLSRETLTRIRRYLGADFVVSGGYTVLASPGTPPTARIRLDVRVQNIQTGEVVKTFAPTGTEDELFDLVSAAGTQLRQALGVAPLSEGQNAALKSAEPSNPEAKRLYYEGLARMKDYEWARARDLLTKAVESDPTFPLTHAALSAVWGKLVHAQRRREEAQTAFDLSPNLLPEERSLVEAEYHASAGDWLRVAQIYRDLFNRFPDNLEYGLALADAQDKQQKAQASLETIKTLRSMPQPPRDDPRIDIAEAVAISQLGKPKESLPLLLEAERKARARGSRGILWDALHLEADNFGPLGKHQAALNATLEARRICAQLGDQTCLARSLAQLGILETHWNLSEAEKYFRESYEVAEREGSFYAANALSNLGAILDMKGDYAGADRALGEAAKATEAAHDKPFLARVTINRGILLFREAKLHAAEGMFRKALAVIDEGDVQTWRPGAILDLAQVLEDEGNLTEAMKLRQQLLAMARASQTSVAERLAWIARLLCLQGDLRAARQTLDQAEVEARKAGDSSFAATHAECVWLPLEEGHAAAVEALARQVENHAEAADSPIQAADACELLARCLLAEGKVADARAAIERARSYLSQRKSGSSAFDISITSARVLASTGDYKDRGNVNVAINTLNAVIVEARRDGFVGAQLEARLARGEIRMMSGQTAIGRPDLESLAKEASAKGFGLIARKAVHAAEGRPRTST
jgi:tetratricopeptide (TPR) repeat protein